MMILHIVRTYLDGTGDSIGEISDWRMLREKESHERLLRKKNLTSVSKMLNDFNKIDETFFESER